MNKAAKLVSDSLTGNDYRTVLIAGKAYSVYPPTIKIMTRGFSHWSEVKFDTEGQTGFSIMAQMPGSFPEIVKGLCLFVTGDVKHWQLKAYRLYRKWMKGTPAARPDEIARAIDKVLALIPAQVFFSSVNSLKSATLIMAKSKSSATKP